MLIVGTVYGDMRRYRSTMVTYKAQQRHKHERTVDEIQVLGYS